MFFFSCGDFAEDIHTHLVKHLKSIPGKYLSKMQIGRVCVQCQAFTCLLLVLAQSIILLRR